MNLNNYLS